VKTTLTLAPLIFLSLLLAFPALAEREGSAQQRVLFIFSYHPDFPTTALILDGIQSVLPTRERIVDFEYMDSKRIYDKTSRLNFYRSLRYKLEKLPAYDLVMTADDNALDFMLEHGDKLLPGRPVVFLGLNNADKAKQIEPNPLYTGLIEFPPLRETIELSQTLLPQRNRLHIIADDTPSGQGDLQKVLNLRNDFPQTEFLVHSLGDMSWEEFGAELQKLGDTDAALLISAFSDADNRRLSFEDSLAFIKAHTDIPIFHLWEHGIGDGLLGGIIFDSREHARAAARIAIRILDGESPADIPIGLEGHMRPVFDFRELERFDIRLSDLPGASVVKFRHDSGLALALAQYRNEILLIATLLGGLLALSAFLIRHNRQLASLGNALQEQSSLLYRLMNTLPDLVWMKDPSGVFISCNKRFEEFLGAAECDIVGKTDYEFVHAELADAFRHHDQRAMDLGDSVKNEEWIQFAGDGHRELIETIKTPVFDDQERLLGVLGVGRNITERRNDEARIRSLSQAVEQSPVLIMVTDDSGSIEYVNHAFECTTGYAREEVVGRNANLLQSGHTPREQYAALWQALRNGESWEGEFRNRKKNGELYWEYAHISPIHSTDGGATRFLGIKEDITLRKLQNDRILRQAQFDSLTELPNRLLSLDRLAQMIASDQRSGSITAVLFIDLDDFKKINDTLGHETGDKLLVEAAARLRLGLRSGDTVGRLGGDEFIVLLGNLGKPSDASPVATQILERLKTPFQIDENELLLTASIGIAAHPDDGDEVGELLRKADAAMYQAKNRGRADYAFYTPQLNIEVRRRVTIEQHMVGALERDEFSVHYQPQIELGTGRLISFEALLRWHNPALGDVSPDEFIPIAEHNGLIVALGHHALKEALQQTSCWRESFGDELRVAVNLSPRQFRDVQLGKLIEDALTDAGVPAEALELEITEGVLMMQNATIDSTMHRLTDKRISLALDDFGTGYASLSYLRAYPFDTIKIDREFTRDIPLDKADRELVVAIVAMAHSLGLKVVAEGVETREQHDLLREIHCDLGQGHLYGRPAPADEIAQRLRNGPFWTPYAG